MDAEKWPRNGHGFGTDRGKRGQEKTSARSDFRSHEIVSSANRSGRRREISEDRKIAKKGRYAIALGALNAEKSGNPFNKRRLSLLY